MIKRWQTKSKWNSTLCSLLSFNEQFSSLLEKSFLLLINYDIQNYDLRLGLLIFWLVDEIQCGIFSSNKFQALNFKQWISSNEFQEMNFKQCISSNAFQAMHFKQRISMNFKQWISSDAFQAMHFNEFQAMCISSNAFQAMKASKPPLVAYTPQVMLPVGVLPG